MKILLVDDEKFVIEGLKNLLDWDSFHGEFVGSARNGQEALDIANSVHPDVIISDIKMPIMDGLELSRIVSEENPQTHIILLSGHGEFEYAQKAISYDVSEYILKPITRDKINLLNEHLIEYYHSLTKKKDFYLKIWDSSLKTKILEAFKHADKETFDEFFSSDLFLAHMTTNEASSTGIQLLNFLYQYLSEIKIDSTIIEESRKKEMSYYLDLPTVDEQINYLITKYYNVLLNVSDTQFTNIDSIAKAAKNYVDQQFKDTNFNITLLAD